MTWSDRDEPRAYLPQDLTFGTAKAGVTVNTVRFDAPLLPRPEDMGYVLQISDPSFPEDWEIEAVRYAPAIVDGVQIRDPATVMRVRVGELDVKMPRESYEFMRDLTTESKLKFLLDQTTA